jgi:hypothetical protein
MLFIVPIILASNFVSPNGSSCAWYNDIVLRNGNIEIVQKRLYGYYENENIYLCPQLTPEEKTYTYFHEYGHYVWHHITVEQQEYWMKLWPESLTKYGSENYVEDFAETFQFVILGKKYAWDSKVIRKKIRFMQLVIQSMK